MCESPRVSPWTCEQQLVLEQRKVDVPSNEITAVLEYWLYCHSKGPSSSVMSSDMMGRHQRNICQQGIDADADDVIGRKSNPESSGQRARGD